MSSTLHTRTRRVATQLPPRVTVKSTAPATGYVDGAWWPRSRDLAAELPALLSELGDRWGPVSRVTYNLDVWNPVERRLTITGRILRLGGFHSQHPDTVTLIGANGQRLTLLVLSPDTTPAAAHHALTTAAQPGNDDRIDTLLALTNTDTDRTISTDHPIQQRWQLDGGRTTERA
jgi:hypothetical protein